MKFYGGIHPKESKTLSLERAIAAVPPPAIATLPLQQHTGAPCDPLVEVGQSVSLADKIADSPAFISSPVHASIAGKIEAIAPAPHPMLGESRAIIIKAEGSQDFTAMAEREWEKLSADEMISIVREAGIVGMGGAAFPTHVKLTVPEGKNAETLIINGAECEPYLTADEKILLTYPAQIIEGIKIISSVVKPRRCIIAIEDNKQEAMRTIGEALRSQKMPVPTEVQRLHTKYPQGSEKQLIVTVTGREVPRGGLPIDVGILMQNVGTAFSVYEAVVKGRPLIERVITVSGSAISKPGNYLVRLGTSIEDVAEFAGGFREECVKVIMGGPLMGVAQCTLKAPVIKGTSGLLFFTRKELSRGEEGPCIRCGSCTRNCPMRLLPTYFPQLARKGKHDQAKEEYNLMECIECGCCTYACPARIPIVQYVRLSKAVLKKSPK
jgi:Na+-translocating ferredoxin:NAD+ oxidoreductase subunit C